MVIEKSPQAFRTISEASEILSLPSHVLRFWESKFKQIKPLKRAGGRRFYRPIKELIMKKKIVIKKSAIFFWDHRYIIKSKFSDLTCYIFDDKMWVKLKKDFKDFEL